MTVIYLESWRVRVAIGSPARDDQTRLRSFGSSEFCFNSTSREWSMAELEEIVAKLLDDPATEPVASEIGGAPVLSYFCSMKNHLGKFYSPSTATMP
jgi:hypothetical protein